MTSDDIKELQEENFRLKQMLAIAKSTFRSMKGHRAAMDALELIEKMEREL